MTYTLTGLPRQAFEHFFGMTDAELAAAGARRIIADAERGFPCRIGLRDAHAGEPLILLNYVNHDVPGPFRTAYAIYVGPQSEPALPFVDRLPDTLDSRALSLRGFDADGLIVDAKLAHPGDGDMAIRLLFADTRVACILAHFAAYGCFAAQIERSDGAMEKAA
ncbi:DUF1203 domain-containing protein [Novosphingobium sp. 9U]|uniref:DUF1203 domain-containing protein n=1 Tax=Novosphingobium sp. 9U TaxID=2653158 RepID=UPI0012F2B38A|nr:DUF1203 domain-containing protein [Novosphingobium sp. 9U]VWX54641.1 conserved hypothetical protein [Novosphingobium sp. 9U]